VYCVVAVRNAIDDLGFLDQVIGIELRCLGHGGGVLHNYRSICRLNLKFESSAILTWVFSFLCTVRNAIDDSGFLDQVIGIELRQIGVPGVERRMFPDLSFYLSSKFKIREICYTYLLCVYFVFCAQCNRRFGFFGSGYRHRIE